MHELCKRLPRLSVGFGVVSRTSRPQWKTSSQKLIWLHAINTSETFSHVRFCKLRKEKNRKTEKESDRNYYTPRPFLNGLTTNAMQCKNWAQTQTAKDLQSSPCLLLSIMHLCHTRYIQVLLYISCLLSQYRTVQYILYIHTHISTQLTAAFVSISYSTVRGQVIL